MIAANMRRFTRLFVLELWPWYLGGIFCLAITNIITLEIPQFSKQLVNSLESTLPDTSSVRHLALAIIGLGLAQIIVRSLSRILIFWPGRKLEASAKSHLFARIIRLPQTFFDRFGMGDLISRFSNDMTQLRAFYAFGVLQIVNLIFLGCFTLYNMLEVHRWLTLSALLPLSILFISAKFVFPKMQAMTKLSQEAVGNLTNRVTETFTNIHVIQANASEVSFQGLIAKENETVYRTDIKLVVLRTLFFSALSTLTGLSQLVVLFYGGYLVTQKEITIGDILAFNMYLAYLAFPLMSIGIITSLYQRSKTALDRLDPILDEAEEQASLAPTPVEGAQLDIRNLTFQYATGTEPALKNVSLSIRRGEMIGICGPIGSGKSTLFQILSRIYDPAAGTVFFEGRDLLSFGPVELRARMAYALQKVHLFSASIRDNLGYGLSEKPTQPQLEAAARAAQIMKEIEAFPAGWDTEIGEKGLRLSGGQKQRLALARVFVRRPDLLLLDDVLSAVDNLTEARLIQEFRRLGCTMLINSHRSSVLHLCDRVVYLHEGRLVDEGPFVQLIARHPELQEEIHEQATPE